jgi:uncharacterized Zn-binding protein involved in type VI secretion
MTGACRIGDVASGHGCFPPHNTITGSNNVFVNGVGSQTVGDTIQFHCCPDEGCHIGTTITGSNSVFVNGRPKTKIGNMIHCGSHMITGSVNVFVGD